MPPLALPPALVAMARLAYPFPHPPQRGSAGTIGWRLLSARDVVAWQRHEEGAGDPTNALDVAPRGLVGSSVERAHAVQHCTEIGVLAALLREHGLGGSAQVRDDGGGQRLGHDALLTQLGEAPHLVAGNCGE